MKTKGSKQDSKNQGKITFQSAAAKLLG